MAKNKERAGLVSQLRDAITKSGLSLNELSKRSGVQSSQLSYFMRGERTLTLPAADRICAALGYHLEKDAPGKPPQPPASSSSESPKGKGRTRKYGREP
jgi:transcriptional regulator with XRE-family HTH domain